PPPPPQLFSIVMNGASCLGTVLVSGIIISILLKTSPKLFLPK
ncbi:energy-coupled thiamine transporter ThiT, partial [Listeria monocytogenes]